MDIEKLIEQLKWWAKECDRTNKGCQARRILQDAATALSTLQDENKLLREKVEDARLEGYAKGIGEMCAELEQVKRERDELERVLGELEGAVYTGQYFHLRPMIEKWRSQREG